MIEMLEKTFLGNTVSRWLLATAVFLIVLLALRLLVGLARRYLHKWTDATRTDVDDVLLAVLEKTRPIVLVLLAASAAIHFLEISELVDATAMKFLILIVVVQVGIWASAALDKWLSIVRTRKADEEEAANWLGWVGVAGKVVIWSLALLFGLENLGADVSSLATSLGIGGIAVALAVQSILGDLFSSFSIYFDKPFIIGDVLGVDSYVGRVEDIGLKTTRLRSLSGEQLVFSNSDLLNSRIRNYGRMYERRAVFSVGVTYETPPKTVEKIPEMVRATIEAQEKVRFDRCHFKEFGDFALIFEAVYYVLVPAYTVYMDIQQAVNLALLERFQDEGIEFAYLTQSVFLQGSVAEAGSAQT
jgi:small-conductance mechanosensitive channel